MPVGNEGNHRFDGLTVVGGLALGTQGPFFAPGDVWSPMFNQRPNTIEIIPRSMLSSSATVASQTARLTFFTSPVNQTISQMSFCTAATAAGATPTIIRYGLYLIDDFSGDGTLVASTPNDTTLLSGTQTEYLKAFSTPYALIAGRKYATMFLIVTAAATPTIGSGVALTTVAGGIRPRVHAALASQSDLPASFTDAGLSVPAAYAYFYSALS